MSSQNKDESPLNHCAPPPPPPPPPTPPHPRPPPSSTIPYKTSKEEPKNTGPVSLMDVLKGLKDVKLKPVPKSSDGAPKPQAKSMEPTNRFAAAIGAKLDSIRAATMPDDPDEEEEEERSENAFSDDVSNSIRAATMPDDPDEEEEEERSENAFSDDISTHMNTDSMAKAVNISIRKCIEDNTVTQEKKDDLNIKKFKYQKEIEEDSGKRIKLISYNERQEIKPSKTILLIGETGAGKSSLLSSLVNIAFGIEFKDNFRLKIFDKGCEDKVGFESQTDWITIHQFNHMSGMTVDFDLTIIDTPGFNDTRGLDQDEKVFNNLEIMLKDDKFKVDELHCIGIVTQASSNRLTETQKYIYEQCLRIFGNDVGKNIHIMATFSDDGDSAIESVLKEANVEYVEIHKFNNSSIYLTNNIDQKDRKAIRLAKKNKLNYEDMEANCGDFLDSLVEVDGQSLTKTKDTLEKRRLLFVEMRQCDKELLLNLDKAEQWASITDDSHWQQNCPNGTQAFNCDICVVTCHRPCYGNNYLSKCENCKGKERCKVCNCSHEKHSINKFYYDHTNMPIEIKKQNILEVIQSLYKISECVKGIDKVALQPNPKSFEKYLEDLIKTNSTPGKVAMLKSIQEEEKMHQNVFLTRSIDENAMKRLIHKIELNSKMEKGVESCKIL